jgi:hypothetical protein
MTATRRDTGWRARQVTRIACAALLSAPVAFFLTNSRIIDRKIDATFATLELLRFAAQRSAEQTGHLATDEEGLQVLTTGPGAWIMHVPQDPWGHPYVYRRTAAPPGFVLYSMGADGIDDHGAGDDITTRDKSYRCETYYEDCRGSAPWWRNVALVTAFLAAAGWLVFCAVRTRLLRARLARAPRHDPTLPASPAS